MPTSSKFLSVCKQCKAFCCTAVLPILTDKEKNRILSDGVPNYFIKIDHGLYRIKEGSNGVCPYLTKELSCSIQNLKPKLCKIWPIIPRYKNNIRETLLIHCPLYPFLSDDEIMQAKKEAETLPLDILRHLWDISLESKNKYKRFPYTEI
jgi:Fe-S-cluster containining protein